MATIKDVAKKAGLSVGTVSKVFNGYSEIPNSTKEKVFQVAKDLDYVPRKSAVELSKKEKMYIGLIVENLSFQYANDEYLFKLLAGVHKRVEELGYELIIYTTKQIRKQNFSYINFCKYHNLVGAIIHGLEVGDPLLKELSSSSIPCVLIDINLEGKNTASITTDNEKAAEEVFDILFSNGHKKICHIVGSHGAEVSNIRKRGFINGAKKNNYDTDDIIFIDGEFNEKVSYKNVKKMMRNHKDITAIFASSDIMALGALKALNELGYKVGEDFTLIGFDGLSTLQYVTPPITTVKQNFEKIGRVAVDTLIRINNKRKVNNKYYVDYKIIQGNSINKIVEE